ncbi:hypothetical protein M3J09_001585 [Ascochyta lentis]
MDSLQFSRESLSQITEAAQTAEAIMKTGERCVEL